VPDLAGTVAAVVGGGMGVGIVVGSVRVLPHPANSQTVNAKPMICSNSFFVLMLVIFLFLVEVILVNYMVLMLLSSPTPRLHPLPSQQDQPQPQAFSLAKCG
jgi:hypothetical protein